MTTQAKSLYDRLGGDDAINALTESWVARLRGDDRANGHGRPRVSHSPRFEFRLPG